MSTKHRRGIVEPSLKKRELFGGLLFLAGFGGASDLAKAEDGGPKGLTPGRVPGLNEEPDIDGYYQYIRPSGMNFVTVDFAWPSDSSLSIGSLRLQAKEGGTA